MAENFKPWIGLPSDRELVSVKSIGRLVSEAILAELEANHSRVDPLKLDPEHDPVTEAQFDFGFRNKSTEPANIRASLIERRAAGRIVVREADGRGTIRDDDVLRGALTREDFGRFIAEEWGIELIPPVISAVASLPQAPSDPARAAATAATPAAADPAQQQAAPAAKATETPQARRARRLARLRELGGGMRKAGNGWHVTGERGALAMLIREEAAADRPMADKTNVRADLAAAMGDQRGT